MAILNASTSPYGIDTADTTLDPGDSSPVTVTAQTSTLITFDDGHGGVAKFHGTGFTFSGDLNGNGSLTGGTITSVEEFDTGQQIYLLSGLSLTVSQLFDIVQANDGAALAAAIFGGNDTIIGSSYGDILAGNTGNDLILGGGGNDSLHGDGGNDFLIGGTGADALLGGSGFDYAGYTGSASGVTARLDNAGLNTGEASGDSYSSIEGLVGSSFADILSGNNSGNTLKGGDGNDTLYGQGGGDTLDGEAGNDLMFGGSGGDTLYGRSGDDRMFGEAGNDELYGSGGNDILFGGDGADVLNGGSGFDYAHYYDATAGFTARLDNPGLNTGYAAGDTYIGIEGLIGSNFDDVLVGDSADNVLKGGNGDDSLYGLGGNDTLVGGAGDDLFDYRPLGGDDVIKDFVAGAATDDVIQFHNVGFTSFADVQAAAAQVGLDTVITIAGHGTLTLENTTLGSLHSDDFSFA